MPSFLALQTERLLLRQWRETDRASFARMNADPEVMRHFPAPLTRSQSDAMMDRCAAAISRRGWGLWAVERLVDGRFVGFVGLHVLTATLPFSPCTEVGWRLEASAWGQGYATEAARAALRTGFQDLDLPEIVSFTALGNVRSRAVMARLGMHQDPEHFDHPSLPPGHPLRRHCLYRLRRQEWRLSNAAP